MALGKDAKMTIKLLGLIFIVFSCGAFGFLIAYSYRREANSMQQLIYALEFMECELAYRLTPLPELCRMTAKASNGIVRSLFIELAYELENQISPDVEHCMQCVLSKHSRTPKMVDAIMCRLGKTLGRFDMEGQLKGISSVRQSCQSNLTHYQINQEPKLRSYQTLGLCAGAAIAILML